MQNHLREELREETIHLLAELEVNVALAKKVHAVIEDSFQFFLHASATAHAKGQRGDIRSAQTFGGVFGHVAEEFVLEFLLPLGSDGGSGVLLSYLFGRLFLMCVFTFMSS